MDVSIIIVNWKVKDLLEACLRSVYKETQGVNFEVFVVDNDSGDGSVEMVKEKFPQVNLTASKDNLGFAKGNNIVAKHAKGRYVLLLNPDTEVLDNAIGKMVEFMDSHPECGISGCKLLNPDLTHQPSVRRFPTFSSQALILLKLHHLFPKTKAMHDYLAEDFDYDKIGEADQVMGAFFMIKREVVEKIGLLDETFWIWFEEVDYCKRAKEAGFKIFYTPEAKIVHHFGQSFKQVYNVQKQKNFNKSLTYYFKKHQPSWQRIIIEILKPISILLAWLVYLVKK